MNILLTNDDGYSSLGILTLKQLLLPYGRVVILAPLGAMSAKSCSITLGSPLHITCISPDVYACSGTPADCVSYALSSLGIDFDLVVSGINHGLNISYDTMFSGTIGACLEAMIFHKKSLAISVHDNFTLVQDHFSTLWEYIFAHDLLGEEHLLNVNFPLGDRVDDIALGTLYYRNDQNYFTKEKDGFLAYRHLQNNFDDQKESDCYQVSHHVVSIVPLSRSYFSPSLYQKLKEKQ